MKKLEDEREQRYRDKEAEEERLALLAKEKE